MHVVVMSGTMIITNRELTRDLWNTTTPNQFHILENAYIPRADVPPPSSNRPEIYGMPLHQISFTYSRMHTPSSN